jgi:hypothetical protein
MRTNVQFLLLAGILFFSSNSCSKKEQTQTKELLIDQKLSAGQLAKLMNESMSIKQLEDYTLVNATTCNNPVLHEGESVQIKAEANIKGIEMDKRLFYMREIQDTSSSSSLNLEIRISSIMDSIYVNADSTTYFQTNDKLFSKLLSRISNDSLFVFQTVVIGKVMSQNIEVNGVCVKKLYLEASDLYLP